jgi:carboxyl-terminal processing protease
MRVTKTLVFITTIALLSMWQLPTVRAQNDATTGITSEARDYLNRALDIIQKNSVKRQTNWDEFRRLTIEKAGDAKTTADTYPAIRDAIKRLGDNHSSLFTPEDLKAMEAGRTGSFRDLGIRVKESIVTIVFPNSSASRAGIEVRDKVLAIDGVPLAPTSDFSKLINEAKKKEAKGVELRIQRGKGETRNIQLEFAEFTLNLPLQGRLITNEVGLIVLPQFSASMVDQKKAKADADQFAEQIQSLIRDLDQKNARGWILDLRLNSGGNMWPMLAGIGPILGEGEVGSFVSGTNTVKWSYRDGKAMIGNNVLSQAATPYRVKQENPPVAILIDEMTASSAEAVVIAFKGRAKTHFFGMPTRGVPTANQPFKLTDGAILNLTTAIEADRTGKSYDSKIPPDTEIKTNWSLYGTDDDPVIQAALKWLKSQK